MIVCDTTKISERFSSRIPIIVVRTVTEPSASFPNVIDIIPNDKAIGRLAAKHLMECGFNYYAYCGFRNMFWSERRQSAFSKTLTSAGHKVYTFKPKNKINSWSKEFQVLCDWLDSLSKPIGIFCCNDERSRSIMEACKTRGLSVPENVAILGVDNNQLICEMAQTPLSSINLNTEKAGYEAAERLKELMAGENTHHRQHTITIEPTNVVTRQSTNILAINDAETANAVRFIRENSNKPINVDDVIDAVYVSRRVLEYRFKKHLGRSIYREIKRYRTELIAKLLLETDISITRIALSLGFPDVNHISRYFRSQKGITPKEFRNKYKGQG